MILEIFRSKSRLAEIEFHQVEEVYIGDEEWVRNFRKVSLVFRSFESAIVAGLILFLKFLDFVVVSRKISAEIS